jgi:hypothetical protein
MSMKEDLLEVVTHWIHDINDYLAADSIAADNHQHDVMKKLVSMKAEITEYLENLARDEMNRGFFPGAVDYQISEQEAVAE